MNTFLLWEFSSKRSPRKMWEYGSWKNSSLVTLKTCSLTVRSIRLRLYVQQLLYDCLWNLCTKNGYKILLRKQLHSTVIITCRRQQVWLRGCVTNKGHLGPFLYNIYWKQSSHTYIGWDLSLELECSYFWIGFVMCILTV